MTPVSLVIGGSLNEGRDQRRGVVVADLLDVVLAEPGVEEVVDERQRLRQPFGVRPVGSHQHVVDADELTELREVVLVERGNPHVAPEHLARVVGERLRLLLVHLVQPFEHRAHPVGAGLDGDEADVRESRRNAVEDERGHRVGDRGRGDRGAHEAEAERLGLAALTPHRAELAVRAVATVEPGDDARLLDTRPDRVEALVARRLVPRGRHHRPVLEDHEPRAAVEHPLELGDAFVDVGQGEVGRGEDPFLVVESPVLVEPAVEGAERGARGRQVVPERLLHPDAQRREEQRAVELLVVHHLQPHVAIAVRRIDRLEVAEEVDDAVTLLVVAAEVLLEAPGRSKPVERRVRDEAVHAAADEQPGASVDLCPLHRALGVLGLDVPRERVHRLVVVVVGVEAAQPWGGTHRRRTSVATDRRPAEQPCRRRRPAGFRTIPE